MLTDSEDARRTLQRAEDRFQAIGNDLIELRMATDPAEWHDAYAQADAQARATTHYPQGTDGAAVMRNTAAALQTTLNRLLMADCTATALDTDMLELRISGMHARALLRRMADHGIIEYPRINSTAQAQR